LFSTATITDRDFDKVILKDEISNTTVEILPTCGAMLHAFTVFNNGELINVIDGYDNEADFKANVTSKGFKGSKLSPFVCRLKNGQYHFGEKDYTTNKFYLDKHAIHGLIYDAAFTVINKWANEKSAGVTLRYQYTATDNGYPFKYTCAVTYELKSGNALTITTTITNNDEGVIPMQDGWHPYFTFGGSINDLQFEFQSKEVVEFDSELLPTGKLIPYEEFGSLKKIGTTQLDNCFTVNFVPIAIGTNPMCVLRDAAKKLQIEIHPDKSYPYLQIYTPPHRNSIAIENLSGAPNAFNNGMGVNVLQPGEAASFTTMYKITSL
jgi:aldose 1-epimerase